MADKVTTASTAAASSPPTWVSGLGEIAFSLATSSVFVFVVVPVLVALLAVYIKAFSRPSTRTFSDIKLEERIVGFDLGTAACVAVLISSLVVARKNVGPATAEALKAMQDHIVGVFIVFLFFLAILTVSAVVLRKKAWSGSPEAIGKRWCWGINALGLLLLIVAFHISGG
jgi:hypothetical protein